MKNYDRTPLMATGSIRRGNGYRIRAPIPALERRRAGRRRLTMGRRRARDDAADRRRPAATAQRAAARGRRAQARARMEDLLALSWRLWRAAAVRFRSVGECQICHDRLAGAASLQ